MEISKMNLEDSSTMQTSSEQSSNWLPWAVIYAAGRQVPVPFVDDWIRNYSMSKTIEAALQQTSITGGTSLANQELAKSLGALLQGDMGFWRSCLTSLLALPVRLVLFPLRRIWTLLTLARFLRQDLMWAYLVFSSVEAFAQEGRLGDAESFARIFHAVEKKFRARRPLSFLRHLQSYGNDFVIFAKNLGQTLPATLSSLGSSLGKNPRDQLQAARTRLDEAARSISMQTILRGLTQAFETTEVAQYRKDFLQALRNETVQR